MKKRNLVAVCMTAVLTMSLMMTGCGNKAESAAGSTVHTKVAAEDTKEDKEDGPDVSWAADAIDAYNNAPLQHVVYTFTATYEDGTIDSSVEESTYDKTNRIIHSTYSYKDTDGNDQTSESYGQRTDEGFYSYSKTDDGNWMRFAADGGSIMDDTYQIIVKDDKTTFAYEGEESVDGVDAIKVKATYPYDTNAFDWYLNAYGNGTSLTEDAVRAVEGASAYIDDAKAATSYSIMMWFNKDDHTVLKAHIDNDVYNNISQYCMQAASPESELEITIFKEQAQDVVYSTNADPISLPTDYIDAQ